MNTPGPAVMSEAEIGRLAEQLEKSPNPDALSLEGLDGLSCALVASPDTVPPSEYLPVVLGDDSGENGAFAGLAGFEGWQFTMEIKDRSEEL